MIKIRIADVAQKNGLANAYSLQKALNCSPTMAARLWKGNFKQIAVDTLERLCNLFKCSSSDLIFIAANDLPETRRTDLPRVHAKVGAEKPQRVPEGGERMLTTIECAERLRLSRRRVNDYITSGELPAKKNSRNHNIIRESDLEKFRSERSL